MVENKDCIDYRYASKGAIRYKQVQLPKEIKVFFKSVAQYENNRSIGVDLMKSGNVYFCLESNPGPGWSTFNHSSKTEFAKNVFSKLFKEKNMRKIYFFAVISAMAMLSKAYSMDNKNKFINSYGYQKYGKETVDTIQTNGSVVLEETMILGLVSVNGSLNAEESAIGSLQVNGQVGLKNCLINNTTTINGSLNADNTKFQKELSVASQKITLATCSVDSLIIREVNGYDGAQVIDLRSGTKVTGSIIVESGNGEIWLSSNSEISDQVSGAKVYRK